MKPKGNILEFTLARILDLYLIYCREIRTSNFVRMSDIATNIVNSPARRFYVSEERAAIVISAMYQGRKIPTNMNSNKLEMFIEIFKRVKSLRSDNPKLSIFEAVCAVVNSPAPKFYMQPRSAIDIIYKIKNGYFDSIFKMDIYEYVRNRKHN